MRRKSYLKPVLAKKLDRFVQHPIGNATFWSVANSLTIMRIFISPIFLFVYLQHEWLSLTEKMLPYVLLSLLMISDLSDAFDGMLARRYNQVTDLGKILDPMADSIFRVSIFLTFTQPPVNIPLLLVFVFIYRDSVISTLRTICALRGFALAARPSGKLKAAIQAAASLVVVSLMIPYAHGKISEETLSLYATFVVSLAAVYSLCSGVDYLFANRLHIQKILIRRSKSKLPVKVKRVCV